MFEHFKETLINIIFSRLFILNLLFIVAFSALFYRVFTLQIVEGENYLNNFQLKTTKERSIPSTRGNIYDRNGNLLAYNELAYSITIEDVYDSDRMKNINLNTTILKVIRMVESNGDKIVSDFQIALDKNGNYEFTVESTKLLRFLADVYGVADVNDLDYKYRTKTADEVIYDLCTTKYFGIGEYENIEDSKSFVPQKGFTKEEILKIVTIRYAMNLNSFQKYISTTIATNVCDKTVAVIMENADILEGVKIEEATIRKYVDSVYFSQIIGYTGKVSADELQVLKEKNSAYDMNDTVGKSGIEYAFETELQGKKGSETVNVDNLGRVLESSNEIAPVAGNDIYLTIDKDLQEAAYNLIEKKLASILLTKIQNVREYNQGENSSSSDIIIPIYDVYNALFENYVIDTNHFYEKDAKETEIAVRDSFEDYKAQTISKLETELNETKTPYNELSQEYQVYESYIASFLYSDGIINSSLVDKNDSTYIAWTTEEVISLNEYINYVISKNWVETSKLSLDLTYADSAEVYSAIIDYIKTRIKDDDAFDKKLYKYMLKSEKITGKQALTLLLEQDLIDVEEDELVKFQTGIISSYEFARYLIENLKITPAQLALDPYSGSMVITDVNNGDVLALVSYPSYDNNKMANGVDAQYYQKLRTDESTPLINYATQQKTAPGSTFKMVSATAGLMEGVINAGSTITCTGLFDKITSPPACWIYPRGTHGMLDVSGGIQNSCNVFFYEVGYRLGLIGENYDSNRGLEKLAKYASLYGLNETSGIEIEESMPQLSDIDSVRSAIGQGTNNFTTVGLARYVTAVANSGTCYELTLLDKVVDHAGNLVYDNKAGVLHEINMENSYWNAIHTGMRRVVEAKRYFQEFPVMAAGKTGTAQESKSRPNHALFVGYAPYNSPEIAIATRIAFGYTSDYAAQLTKDVLAYYYDVDEASDNPLTKTATTLTDGVIGAD